MYKEDAESSVQLCAFFVYLSDTMDLNQKHRLHE